MKHGQHIPDEKKIRLFDEVVNIVIESENREDVTREELKKYGNPCGMAGYKILRMLFDNKVIEPGREGSMF